MALDVLLDLEWTTGPPSAFTQPFDLSWETPRQESSIALLKVGHELVEVPLFVKSLDGLIDPVTGDQAVWA